MIFKVLSGPFFAPPIAVLHVDDFPTDDRAKVGNFITPKQETKTKKKQEEQLKRECN